ncbi:MAG TPA: glutamine amidotransferase [Planctomycetaceae bacterium]|nr:glutamine amidotransferase [Planctomycetaceae bacterium]
MILAGLLFGHGEWWAPALLAIAVCAVILAAYYRRLAMESRWFIAGAALKWVAVGLLAFFLTEPLWSSQRARPGANVMLLIADNSQSMALTDPGTTGTRAENLQKFLTTTDAPWHTRLEQDFDVRRYLFDSYAKYVADFSTLTVTGDRSDIGAMLRSLKERLRDRPVAGILLFTDGNSTDAVTAADWSGLPPVYPVSIGETRGHRDLAISNVTVSTTSFEDAPVTLQAEITQQGFPGATVSCRVEDLEGQPSQTETQTFGSKSSPLVFRFQLRPTATGVTFYRVRIGLGEPKSAFEEAAGKGETTLANNSRLVTADRGAGPYRLLYVSGRPNWEYKFLRRALEGDDQLDLTAMIRIARKEAKFEFRSREGEGSNPLFRGFDRTNEDTERYDQPVIVRLNTKTSEELREGFPKTPEALYKFHAVILDDIEAAFFTTEQLALLERFVSERGGGLLMLGGQESFRQGGYQKTPLARALPVYLDAAQVIPPANGYRLGLTREGWLQPWARLRSTEGEETRRIKDRAGLLVLNTVSGLKPGASAIADVIDARGQKQPALIAHQFGQGRSAALLAGDLWRWQIEQPDDLRAKDDLGKAWRQMLRWLIVDVPSRIELKSQNDESQGTPLVRLQARLRDAEFRTLDNAAVTMTLTPPTGEPITIPAEPSLSEPGLYETMTSARPAGAWRATVDVVDADGKPVGDAKTGWAADPLSREFERVAPNETLLKDIAAGTKGRVVELSELASFVTELPQRDAPLTETTTTPLWHHPLMWLAVVLGLCGEWAIRRRRGLP